MHQIYPSAGGHNQVDRWMARWSGVMQHACHDMRVYHHSHHSLACVIHHHQSLPWLDIPVCHHPHLGYTKYAVFTPKSPLLQLSSEPGYDPQLGCIWQWIHMASWRWYDMTWWMQQHMMRCVMQHAMCITTRTVVCTSIVHAIHHHPLAVAICPGIQHQQPCTVCTAVPAVG